MGVVGRRSHAVDRFVFNARFEGEARTSATLTHSNVCQLWEVGPNYLVMQLIDNQTLTGPMPNP
jgi:eukaryotic-like serine/threonine-protein kinase